MSGSSVLDERVERVELEELAFMKFPEAKMGTETGTSLGICENDLNLPAPTQEAEAFTGDSPALLSASFAPANCLAKVLGNIFWSE